ncbi:transcription termination factor 2-like [Anoplolepis gracilipes]|uniref:transcription termination factor 2-like n=1 Tax=Anoplolepis gracilipes TaxID=354296 RepID=UPI003B9E0F71
MESFTYLNKKHRLRSDSIVISDSNDDAENSEFDRRAFDYNKDYGDILTHSTPTNNKFINNIPVASPIKQKNMKIIDSDSATENLADFLISSTENDRKRKDISHDTTREDIKKLKLKSSNESLIKYHSHKQDDIDHEISDHKIPDNEMKTGATLDSVTIELDSDSSYVSNSESEEELSFTKQEIGVGNIDLLVPPKRANMISKLKWLTDKLIKTKLLLTEGNIDKVLPDKGQRLHESIREQENEIEKLKLELKKIPLVQNNISKEAHLATKGLLSIQNGPYSNDSDDSNASDDSDEADDSDDLVDDSANPDNLNYSSYSNSSNSSDHSYLDFNNIRLRSTMSSELKLGAKAEAIRNKEFALTVERLKDLHGSLVSCPAENKKAKDPEGLTVQLMPHQQHALEWLLWREQQKPAGGVLADDMGLGKTLTMISLIIATLHEKDSMAERDDSNCEWSNDKSLYHKGGTLVVCPASLLSQWANEVRTKCKRGLLSVEIYHGSNRRSIPKQLSKNNIVITTYNLLIQERKLDSTLYKINWKRVILDEAHVVRNYNSQGALAVWGLKANKRWAVTGTPIQNRALDLFSILKFLKCSPFDDLRVWKRWVNSKSATGYERLATVMKTLMLRRTKQELAQKGDLATLPDKFFEEVTVKLDPEEQLVYKKVLFYSRTLFVQFLTQKAENKAMFNLCGEIFVLDNEIKKLTKAQNKLLAMHAKVKTYEILVLLLRLRQLCCHPALIHAMLDQDDLRQSGIVDADNMDLDFLSRMNNISLDKIDDSEEDFNTDQRLVGNLLTAENPVFDEDRISSKMRAMLKIVRKILQEAPEDKLIIVSQWTTLLDVIASHLPSIKDATFSQFTGNVDIKDRQNIVDSFNSRNSGPRILLLSLTVGGVGLNLVGGNHLLLFDVHWNPQLETQAQDRIHRFGQTKNVYIYKFICADTIEERIKGLQEKKLEIARSVLSGDKNATVMKLTLNDLKSLFGF